MEIDCDLKTLYHSNHSVHDPWYWLFIIFYTTLTLSSFLCNALLLIALYFFHKNKRWKESPIYFQNRRVPKHPRPGELTRDILISHLAILDLFLCFTMPFSALDGLSKFWPLGPNTEFLCKMTKAIPTTVVYSSSMLVMLIAYNCYSQIVHPHKPQIVPSNLKYYSFIIVFVSLIMSSPQYYYTTLFPTLVDERTSQILYNITYLLHPNTTRAYEDLEFSPFSFLNPDNLNETYWATTGRSEEERNDDCRNLDKNGWDNVIFCVEDWPFGEQRFDQLSRLYYTIFSFVLQLVIPLIMISICYLLVYCKLREQSNIRNSLLNFYVSERLQKAENRCRRRNKHLVVISVVYLASWLPLGLILVLIDSKPAIFGSNTSHITMIFVSCHLLGMLSATVNPIIYGYKNKHIRKGIHIRRIYGYLPISIIYTWLYVSI